MRISVRHPRRQEDQPCGQINFFSVRLIVCVLLRIFECRVVELSKTRKRMVDLYCLVETGQRFPMRLPHGKRNDRGCDMLSNTSSEPGLDVSGQKRMRKYGVDLA